MLQAALLRVNKREKSQRDAAKAAECSARFERRRAQDEIVEAARVAMQTFLVTKEQVAPWHIVKAKDFNTLDVASATECSSSVL